VDRLESVLKTMMDRAVTHSTWLPTVEHLYIDWVYRDAETANIEREEGAEVVGEIVYGRRACSDGSVSSSDLNATFPPVREVEGRRASCRCVC
jgi:hypothetical protein